jgi:DNA-binding response OmpR family regulator
MPKEKILIVEDEEDIQELIRYNLEKEGFKNLKVVDNGEKAIEALKSFSPDIILLD